MAGVSRRSLERRFRRALGRSPHAEIQRLRLERSQQMLQETALSLAAIAERSGWSSVQRFMAVFKARMGQTPGQFRNKQSRPEVGSAGSTSL
jgi:LacI family transcriptional regulator